MSGSDVGLKYCDFDSSLQFAWAVFIGAHALSCGYAWSLCDEWPCAFVPCNRTGRSEDGKEFFV